MDCLFNLHFEDRLGLPVRFHFVYGFLIDRFKLLQFGLSVTWLFPSSCFCILDPVATSWRPCFT